MKYYLLCYKLFIEVISSDNAMVYSPNRLVEACEEEEKAREDAISVNNFISQMKDLLLVI